jgi:putative transposase
MVQSEMKAEGNVVSIKKLCGWFKVARSTVYYRPSQTGPRPLKALDMVLTEEVRKTIEANPTYGVRYSRRKAKSSKSYK